MVTTVFPSASSRQATDTAAARAAPEEMPHKRPSVRPSSRQSSKASGVRTLMTVSYTHLSRLQAGPLQKFGNGLFGLTGDLLIHDKDLLGDKIPNHIFPQYTTKSEKCIRPWRKRKSGLMSRCFFF